ncbi:hypothetical protein H2204_002996 [Knufia peltigerae]|uniref:Major facilitator superfamily (MFS) profile domain-containing protein n=1 Tax=Knufia peltigerae TaxID=1002370 RepID=A0AA38YAE5_9EURO|nr:hypothetical protein H2204_002996 [Knufia peltigerae]
MSIPPKVKETSAQLEQLEIFSGVAAEDVLIKPKNHAFHAEQPKTPEELKAERRFVRKIDLWILPLLSVMYFLASLDRGDVGFAASVGLTEELHISSHQLSTIVSLFSVGYIVFQLPGDIFLRVVTPPVQLGIALCVWGTFTASCAAANSYSALAGLRFGVGMGEAFLQAGVIYLSLWYKRNELATRGAWFFSTSALAGAFNGLVGYGIFKNLNGAHGLPAWKWIFLIEAAIFCYVQINFACLSIFLPVIIKSFGYSTLDTQLFAVAVFGTGAISTVSFGYLSDWLEQRAICLLACLSFDGAGWILLLASSVQGVRLAGCFLISIGSFPGIILLSAWTTSNITGFTRRAGLFAIQGMVGQCFVVVAAQIYSDKPLYRRGNAFALGSAVVDFGFVAGLRFYLMSQNKKKVEARNDSQSVQVESLDPEGLGDRHPDFTYYL